MDCHTFKNLLSPWLGNIQKLSQLIAFSILATSAIVSPAVAEEFFLSEEENSTIETDPIPSVSELRDILPTDWAYSALENLAVNYNCLIGFPDSTYRGKASLSRNEFAVMLHACLEKISQTVNLKPEDLPTIDRLRQEYTLDIALLRGKTDGIQARVQDLEVTQFSNTAKLNGNANFAITETFSGEGETQTTLQQRVNLDILSSFTGRDRFKLTLTVGNGTIPQLAGGTSEIVQSQQFFGDTGSQVKITNLSYSTTIVDGLYLTASAIGGMQSDYSIAPINPFLDDNNRGTTTLSVFGQKNSIDSLGGGTGVGLIYEYNESLSIGLGYHAAEAFEATEGKGLFNGSYTTGIKLRWQPSEDLTFGFNYQRGYFNEGDFAFDSNGKVFGFAPTLGTATVNNTLAQFATISNSYGGEFFWRVNSSLGVGGWIGYTDAEAIDLGDGEIWNYALTLVFPDLGKEGNLGGIIFGVQPYLASFTGESNLSNDTPLHLEVFYKYQLLDNISLTSGLTWQLAPNQNNDNEDIVMGTMRLNFGF